MDAPMQIDMGMEKLEASLTFAEYSPELFSMLGLMEGNKTNIVLRGAVQGDDTAVIPVVITLQGGFKETDMGSWKTGSKGTLKAQIAARYYKLEIGGVEIIEIDVENMIRVISGVDQTAAQRAALGF
jgi:P2 family phage contractile tail tube protein